MKKTILFLIGSFLLIANANAQDTLKVGYNLSPPFIIENESITEGLNFWLWQRVAEETGLQYELIKMPLDSIIQSLKTNEIDIAITPLTITGRRSKLMDFTSPYFITHSGILAKSSGEGSFFPILNAIWSWKFIKSLGALAIIICFFGFSLWLFERRKNTEQFDKGWRGIGNGIWWSAVTMTTVGYGDTAPKTPMGKIIATVWMFVAIMMISGFTASITSSLTISDLSEASVMGYKNKAIGTLKESATDDWVINHFFSKVNSYHTMDEAIEAMNQGEIEAIAADSPMLGYLEQQDDNKGLVLQDIKYNPQMYSFGISENVPDQIKEDIEYALLKIVDTQDWKFVLNNYGLLDSGDE